MDYREWVRVSIGWMIVGGLFCATTALVFLVWMGPIPGAVVLVGLTALIGGWMLSLTYRIEVDDRGIRVASSLLEWPYVGSAGALSVSDTAELSGPRADARAWFRMPPYLRRAVHITIDDPADPHPYWMVGTRRPEEFAAAIGKRIEARSSARVV